jgi:hypothetical protein
MRRSVLFIALIVGAASGRSWAGEAPCWYDNGAVVVSASVGDIAGDFILDLATPKSQLHKTRAESDGTEGDDFRGPLRLAGERLGEADFAVANLNARTWGFPSEISGVIGADVLAGYVVDLRLSPCRIGLWRGRAPRFRASRWLRLRPMDGVATVAADVSDGVSRRSGRFALETGGAGVRLNARAAGLSRAPPAGLNPTSRSQPPARLRALTLAGSKMEELPAGIDPDAPPGRLGDLGNAVWARYAMRIDLARGRLELAPAP